MREPYIAVVPAPKPGRKKSPHRCFFPTHGSQDKHPSAVTFFRDDGTCTTFCAKERRSQNGTYEIRGGQAYIFPPSYKPDKRKTLSLPPGSHEQVVKRPGRNLQETNRELAPEQLLVAICRDICRRASPQPINTLTEDDVWYVFLESKRVNVERASQVENPPVVFPVGIFFPAHIYYQATLVSDGGQLRSIGLKAISLWRSEGMQHYYVPFPSLIPQEKVCFFVESPFVALRLAYLGYPSVATFGKCRNEEELQRAFGAIPIIVWDEPGGHIVQDFDMLSDESIVSLMRRWKCYR